MEGRSKGYPRAKGYGCEEAMRWEENIVNIPEDKGAIENWSRIVLDGQAADREAHPLHVGGEDASAPAGWQSC